MAKKITQAEFIERAHKLHGNKYDYRLTVFIGTEESVKIICPVHGAFEQKASGHLEGKGCISCGRRKRATTAEFVAKAKEIYGEKYTYEKTEYVQTYEAVIITCSTHGDFEGSPSHILRGKGCAKCRQDAKPKPKVRPKLDRARGYENRIMEFMRQRNVQ